MKSYTKKVAFGSIIVLSLTFLNNIITYFTRMFLARNLSPSEYGLFYSVLTFVMFFLFFRDLGLGKAAIKHISESRVKNRYDEIKTYIFVTFFYQFISSFLLIVVLYIYSDFLVVHYFKVPLAKSLLNILILYILFSLLFVTLKYIFNAFQKFILFSLVDITKSLLIFFLMFILFKLNYGIFSPAWAYILAVLILFFIFLPFVLKTFNILNYKLTNTKIASNRLFAFGIPVMLSGVGGRIISYADTLILTYMTTMHDVGVYNVILPTAMLFVYLGNALGNVLFPIASELHTKKDYKKLNVGLKLMQKYVFFIIIPVVLSVFIYSEYIITFLFSINYIEGVMAFRILLIGVMFYILLVMNNNFISAIGKPASVTKIILFSAVLNFVINILLIPNFGINGAAIATTLSYCVGMILSVFVLNKYLNLEMPYIIWLKLVVAGGVFYFLLNSFKSFLMFDIYVNFFIGIFISYSVYLFCCYILNIISIPEVKRYLNLIFK